MARRKCPRRGSKKTAKILYGMPVMDDKLQEQFTREEWQTFIHKLFHCYIAD